MKALATLPLILLTINPLCGQRISDVRAKVLGKQIVHTAVGPTAVGTIGPFTAAGNFAADIAGSPDSRPGAWGNAGAVAHDLVFNPPPGYRVQILSIRGDYVLWPTTMGNGPAIVPDGTHMGGLAGASTTGPEGSVGGDWMADGTMMYVQAVSSNGAGARVAFDVDLHDVQNNVLEADHTLRWKQAVWLNDTGLMGHMEVTFSSLVYQFVPEE